MLAVNIIGLLCSLICLMMMIIIRFKRREVKTLYSLRPLYLSEFEQVYVDQNMLLSRISEWVLDDLYVQGDEQERLYDR